MQNDIRNLERVNTGDILTFVSARPVNLVELILGQINENTRIMEQVEVLEAKGDRISGVIRSGKPMDHRSRPIHFSRKQGVDTETNGIIINKRYKGGYKFLLETLAELVELQYSSNGNGGMATGIVERKLS